MFGAQLTATMYRGSVIEAGLCQRIKYILAACIIVSGLVWLLDLIGNEMRCQISPEILNAGVDGNEAWVTTDFEPCHRRAS
jgi:hypothetical protein